MQSCSNCGSTQAVLVNGGYYCSNCGAPWNSRSQNNVQTQQNQVNPNPQAPSQQFRPQQYTLNNNQQQVNYPANINQQSSNIGTSNQYAQVAQYSQSNTRATEETTAIPANLRAPATNMARSVYSPKPTINKSADPLSAQTSLAQQSNYNNPNYRLEHIYRADQDQEVIGLSSRLKEQTPSNKAHKEALDILQDSFSKPIQTTIVASDYSSESPNQATNNQIGQANSVNYLSAGQSPIAQTNNQPTIQANPSASPSQGQVFTNPTQEAASTTQPTISSNYQANNQVVNAQNNLNNNYSQNYSQNYSPVQQNQTQVVANSSTSQYQYAPVPQDYSMPAQLQASPIAQTNNQPTIQPQTTTGISPISSKDENIKSLLDRIDSTESFLNIDEITDKTKDIEQRPIVSEETIHATMPSLDLSNISSPSSATLASIDVASQVQSISPEPTSITTSPATPTTKANGSMQPIISGTTTNFLDDWFGELNKNNKNDSIISNDNKANNLIPETYNSDSKEESSTTNTQPSTGSGIFGKIKNKWDNVTAALGDEQEKDNIEETRAVKDPDLDKKDYQSSSQPVLDLDKISVASQDVRAGLDIEIPPIKSTVDRTRKQSVKNDESNDDTATKLFGRDDSFSGTKESFGLKKKHPLEYSKINTEDFDAATDIDFGEFDDSSFSSSSEEPKKEYLRDVVYDPTNTTSSINPLQVADTSVDKNSVMNSTTSSNDPLNGASFAMPSQSLDKIKALDSDLDYKLSKEKASSSSVISKTGIAIASMMSLLIIVAFSYSYVYPQLSFRLAAKKAGFDLGLNNSVPRSYTYQKQYSTDDSKFSYQVAKNINNYNIVKERSNLTQENFVNDYISRISQNYLVKELGDRQVYILDNNKAIWLKDGIITEVEANNSNDSEQLTELISKLD